MTKRRPPQVLSDGEKTMVQEACGKYSTMNRPHEFWRFGSICWLCFGEVDHYNHWLPHEIQNLFDKRVYEECS